MNEVMRGDSTSSGSTAIANQTGGDVPSAETAVIAITPSSEPTRSAVYARSGRMLANSGATALPAQTKIQTTSRNIARIFARLIPNRSPLRSTSAVHSANVGSGNAMRSRL